MIDSGCYPSVSYSYKDTEWIVNRMCRIRPDDAIVEEETESRRVEHRLVNSVRHIYHPIPPQCRRAYPMCKVKVTTDLGSTEMEVGDSVIYNGKQLDNPETFDYSSIPPGETIHHHNL